MVRVGVRAGVCILQAGREVRGAEDCLVQLCKDVVKAREDRGAGQSPRLTDQLQEVEAQAGALVGGAVRVLLVLPLYHLQALQQLQLGRAQLPRALREGVGLQ